jgi:hypothetical protein
MRATICKLDGYIRSTTLVFSKGDVFNVTRFGSM